MDLMKSNKNIKKIGQHTRFSKNIIFKQRNKYIAIRIKFLICKTLLVIKNKSLRV